MNSPGHIHITRRLCWSFVLLMAWLVVGETMAEPENPPSSSESAPAAASASGSDLLPSANEGVNNAQTSEGGTSPEQASRLFGESSTSEQDQANDAEKRRDAMLKRSQAVQSTVDTLSRITFGRAQTNAESLYNGIGGVPQPLNPLYMAPGSKEPSGFLFGPLTLHPTLSAGISYGTVSGSSGTRGTSGFYGSLSPAFTLTLGEPATGRTLSAQYTGSLSYGEDNAGRRLYDQSLSASGTLNFVKLNLGAGLDFSQLSGSDRDFGGQNVNRQIIGLSLSASYIYSEKANFSTALSVPIRLFGQGISSEAISDNTFINYVYSPLTTVGVGFGIGMVTVEQGQTQVFEQALSRFTYLLSERLTFNGTFGCEFRDAGTKEQIAPVFGLGLAWAFRETTTLSLSGERRIQNSASQTETNYTDTSVSATLSQRLGDAIQLTGTAGYENADYTGVVRGVSSNRSDNQLILQGAASYRFRDRWVLTGIISYSKNFSNRNAFESLQNSLQLSYVF